MLRKHITCKAVARRGWLRAEKAAAAWNVGMGYLDVKTPDLKWTLIEKAPIVHSGEGTPMFLITFLSE